MPLIIDAVNTTDNYFRVLGDVTEMIATNDFIQVQRSTNNNGVYHVSSSVYSSGHTIITVTEPIPSSSVNGFIVGGVYGLRFSQETIPGKGVLVITPYATNLSTSLVFNGKANLNYGEHQQRNILRLLENFASETAPLQPTIGQHWYDYANQVTKTFVGGSTWSSDVNVESGVISFKDAAHPVANTKFFLTGSTATDFPGVVLYPAANPIAGMSLFQVCDSDLDAVFGIEFDGTTFTTNALQVRNAGISTVNGSLVVNTAGNATGATINRTLVLVDGDIHVESGHSISNPGGGSVTLNASVVLRGSSTTQGAVIQSTGGDSIATFSDGDITFTRALTATNVTGEDAVFDALGVNGTGTFEGVVTETLSVTGATTMASVSATTLTVSGLSTLASVTATTVDATGTVSGTTGSFTALTASGVVSIGTTTAASLTVSGNTTLSATTAASLTVTGNATLAVTSATSLSVTGATTLAGATISGTSALTTATVSGTLSVTGQTSLVNVSSTGLATLTDVTAEEVSVSGTAALTDVVVNGTISVQDPTQDQHAATKEYVDDAIAALVTQQNINFWMGI